MCIATRIVGGEGGVDLLRAYTPRKSGSSRRSALRTLASTLPPIFTGGMCIGFRFNDNPQIR